MRKPLPPVSPEALQIGPLIAVSKAVPPGEAWFVTTDIKDEVTPTGFRTTITYRRQGRIIGLTP